MTKVWFITGSSRGLGRSLTKAVLEAGYHVAATSRNPKDKGIRHTISWSADCDPNRSNTDQRGSKTGRFTFWTH